MEGQILIKTDAYELHLFNRGDGVPILINPPFAGRDWEIAENLINKCIKNNKTVYIFRLLEATQRTKNTSIEDLVLFLHECVQCVGEPVDLICMCQGSLAGTIYTSIFQENINRYVNIAGTINSRTGCNNLIERYMDLPFILEYHTGLVALNCGIQKGYLQYIAFGFIDPVEVYFGRHVKKYNLMNNNDTEGVEKWNKNNSWYDNFKDIAGCWYLQDFEWLFRDNRLYNGTFPNILGKEVRLENITCDVFAFAGKLDKITHETQCVAVCDKVSGRTFQYVFPNAGHSRCFTGKEELDIIEKVFLKTEKEDNYYGRFF